MTEWLPEPDYGDALKQSCIPLDLRCEACNAMGKIRGRFSYALYDDFIVCPACNGARSCVNKSKITKCSSADKYKALRYPTCNKGNPCETCLKKWRENTRFAPIR